MAQRKYNVIALMLLLSGLVHGVVFFYQQNDVGDDYPEQRASVTVQLELLAQPSVIAEKQALIFQSAEKVVAINNQDDSNIDNDAINEEVSSVESVQQSAVDAEVVQDFSDQSISQLDYESGERASQLKKYVYQAISREKRYPYIARKQRREGVVKLNFVMHPDGQVTDILIVESSRYSVLDKAARQAVEAISPFLMATNYLQVETEFNVDIDYRLN